MRILNFGIRTVELKKEKLEGKHICANNLSCLKDFVCSVTEEDNIKYDLGAIDFMGTLVVEFNKEEFQNWKRTKNIDEMINETI